MILTAFLPLQFCEFCRNPTKLAIKSQRTSYQLNHWLKKALDPVFMPTYYPQYSHQTPVYSHHNSHQNQFVPNPFEDEDDDDNSYQVGHHSFDSQVQATNLLSAALLDVMRNLHSLNVKISSDRQARKELQLKKMEESVNGEEIKEEKMEEDDDVKDAEIIERQARLKECLELISAKLEKIENEMEAKDSFDIHTSSSTLTAASPENYGQFTEIGQSSGTSAAAGTDLPSTDGKADSFSMSQGSNDNLNNTTLENTASVSNSVIKTEDAENKGKESEGSTTTELVTEASTLVPPLTSTQTPATTEAGDSVSTPPVDTVASSNDISAPATVPFTEILPSSPAESKAEVEQKPLQNSIADTINFALPTTPSVEDQQLQLQQDKLQQHHFQVPSLARLFIPPGQYDNLAAGDDSLRLEHHHNHPRPTMTHDYLPLGMDDSHLKLEIAYHHKDLKVAREIVMSLK